MAPIEIVVDGTDSGGKTPCVEALQRAFSAIGVVRTCAPFRVREVYPLWATDPRLAAATIREAMDDFRAAETSDVIVWDRGWPTAWVSTDDPVARDLLLPFPDFTVLLLNSVQTTQAKVAKHGLSAEWVTDPALVQRYHDAYHDLPRALARQDVIGILPDADQRYDFAEIVTLVGTAVGLPGLGRWPAAVFI